MGKYTESFNNVYSVFGTPTWLAENIKTVPSNFIETINNSNYIRVSVIPSGEGINLKSINGLVIIDIFVEAGLGPSAITTIADKLDTYLVGKGIQTINGLTQFQKSSMSLLGRDSNNDSLYRAKYEIVFNHFGV